MSNNATGDSDSSILALDAEIALDFSTENEASVIFHAINPETKEVASERARTTITQDGNVLHIKIEAEDLTAMRASMNSFLAWISACQQTLTNVSDGS